jgi:enterochelin esterase family protein
MKRLAIALFLLSTYCGAQAPSEFQQASTNAWGAEYPRVDAKGRPEFRINAPNATAVKLNFWSNPKLDMV